MLKLNQKGSSSRTGLALVLVSLALVGALIFGIWAFSQRQNYKNNADQLAATAVAAAEKQATDAQAQKDAEAAKSPLTTYNGSSDLGSIVINYPKTWSGYVDTSGGQAALDGYFYGGVIPTITDPNSYFALRVQVQDQTYDQIASSFSTQAMAGQTIQAYSLPKVPKVVGVKIIGPLSTGGGDSTKSGILVILPLRDKTLEIWTEGNQYQNDFNNYILPNFSFSP